MHLPKGGNPTGLRHAICVRDRYWRCQPFIFMETITPMNLKTAIAITVAAAFALPLAAQASADADKIIVAQSGSTMQPKDSNPAAPPATFGPGKTDSSTTTTAPKAESDRPASTHSSNPTHGTSSSQGVTGTATAPITGGSNSADRPANTPKAETGATAKGGFAAIDKNHDGYISRDEARDATWANRFSELDKDNDGRLSQSEFDAMQAGAGESAKPNAPLTSGGNAADRKPNTPKQ